MQNSIKKNWIKISCGYANLHIMSFITTKFHEILLSCFRGVALTRKTGLTDWLTDWLNDWRTGKKHYTLRNSLRGVKLYIFQNKFANMITDMLRIFLCKSYRHGPWTLFYKSCMHANQHRMEKTLHVPLKTDYFKFDIITRTKL